MTRSQKSINEEKTTAASYIITFYKEVQELSHNFSLYENVILELENKIGSGGFDLSKVDEGDKNTLIQVVQTVRYHAHKCILQYECITQSVGVQREPSVKDSYEKIKKNFIIEREDLFGFVKAMNMFLIKDIMKHLLEDSQETIDNIYKDD